MVELEPVKADELRPRIIVIGVGGAGGNAVANMIANDVRGVDFIGTPLTAFSKIVAADDKVEVFNGLCGAESGWVPVSAVSPGLLLSQVEVQKKPKSQERPPILPPPDAGQP